MRFNFDRIVGRGLTVVGAERFRELAAFVRAYNEIKATGITTKADILNEMSTNPRYAGINASAGLLRQVELVGGRVPETPAEEREMIDAYNSYANDKLNQQESRVTTARQAYETNRDFTDAAGNHYSAKELRERGALAGKKASSSTAFMVVAAIVGALIASAIFPAAIGLGAGALGIASGTSVVVASLQGLASLIGLAVGGVVGKRVYDANGRGAERQRNKQLHEFYQSSVDAINARERELEAATELQSVLDSEFGISRDAYGNAIENAVDDIYRHGVSLDVLESGDDSVVTESGIAPEDVDEDADAAEDGDEDAAEDADEDATESADDDAAEDDDEITAESDGEDTTEDATITEEERARALSTAEGHARYIIAHVTEVANHANIEAGTPKDQARRDVLEMVNSNLTIVRTGTSLTAVEDAVERLDMQRLITRIVVQDLKNDAAQQILAEHGDPDNDSKVHFINQAIVENIRSWEALTADPEINDRTEVIEHLVDVKMTYALLLRARSILEERGAQIFPDPAILAREKKALEEREKFMYIMLENAAQTASTVAEHKESLETLLGTDYATKTIADIDISNPDEALSYAECRSYIIATDGQVRAALDRIIAAETITSPILEADEHVDEVLAEEVVEVEEGEHVEAESDEHADEVLAEEVEGDEVVWDEEIYELEGDEDVVWDEEIYELEGDDDEVEVVNEGEDEKRAQLEAASVTDSQETEDEEDVELMEYSEGEDYSPEETVDSASEDEVPTAQQPIVMSQPVDEKPQIAGLLTDGRRGRQQRRLAQHQSQLDSSDTVIELGEPTPDEYNYQVLDEKTISTACGMLTSHVRRKERTVSAVGRYVMELIENNGYRLLNSARNEMQLESTLESLKQKIDLTEEQYRKYVKVKIQNKVTKQNVFFYREISENGENNGVTRGPRCKDESISIANGARSTYYQAMINSYINDYTNTLKRFLEVVGQTEQEIAERVRKEETLLRKTLIQELKKDGAQPFVIVEQIMQSSFRALEQEVNNQFLGILDQNEQE